MGIPDNPSLPPSQETNRFWIYADNPNASHDDICHCYDPELDYSGKWLLYVRLDELDAAWELIRQSTESGRLGTQSKTSTAKTRGNYKVVCVYTRDCREIEDVRRVVNMLRKLGFLERLFYKENAATYAGQYERGSASLYESPDNGVIIQRREITNL